jgi:hypothetical protein
MIGLDLALLTALRAKILAKNARRTALAAAASLVLIHASSSVGLSSEVTLERVGRIPIGGRGGALVLSHDDRQLYTTLNQDDAVAVISTKPRKLTSVIHVGHVPCALAVSPDGKRIYVAQWGGGLSIIESATGAVAAVPLGGPVAGLALSADGGTLYLAMCRSGIRKMDTRTQKVTTIYHESCAWGITLSPDQKFLWVNFQGGGPGGRSGHNTIAKLEAATGKLIGAATGLANVGGAIHVSHDGQTVWADGLDACSARAYDHVGCPAVPAGIVHVVDTTTLKHLRSFMKAPGGTLVCSRDRTMAAATGTRLLLIDLVDFRPVASLADWFASAAFSSDNTRLYATSIGAREVAIIRVRRR